MKNVFIANVRADYPQSVRTKADFINGTAAGSDTTSRFLWHAEDGDIVILPERVDPRYVRYVTEMLGIPQDALHVIEINSLLTDETLLDKSLVSAVKEYIADKENVVLHPFVQTRGTVEFGRQLDARIGFGESFAHENGVDLLNSKANFRKIAAGVGLPIASGTVARSRHELYEALRVFRRTGNPLIVKHDHAGGGHGNIILAPKSSVRSNLPGARKFLNLDSSLKYLAREIWRELTDDSYSTVTVEVYEESQERFYLEYNLTNECPLLLSTGSIRYGNYGLEEPPKWTGLEVPFALQSSDAVLAVGQGQSIVNLIHSLGYRGMLNLDGIITSDGRVIFQEVNARWGGGLVYDVIARRLLGKSYPRTHVLRSLLDMPETDHDELMEKLTKTGLHYSAGQKEGAIILANRSDLGNGAELLLIASKDNSLDCMEAKVREAVAS